MDATRRSTDLSLQMPSNGSEKLDDDGRETRTGTLFTATAHIITAVIGCGVLSLAWSVAQLGWLGGSIVLIAFSAITWFCSVLLADCYRSPDPINGKRNHTYMECVRANLGGVNVKLCAVAQYVTLVGVAIGYAITTSISMVAIKRSNCFHTNGHDADCHVPLNTYMIIFACIEIVLSQLPNFHKIWGLSVVAAIMSIGYSMIGLGLSAGKIAEGNPVRTSLTGITVGVDVSGVEKLWRVFQATGNIASAYSFSMVLIEIQDTLKSIPPENKVMKKASFIGISVTTLFYMLCGLCGYAAFGNNSPGNLLTGFGFYEPFWLVDTGNIFIVVHLVGAYQVFVQPVFQFVENWSQNKLSNGFVLNEHTVNIPVYGPYSWSFFRLIWRTVFVIITTLVAFIFPFFNDILGLMGGLTFWPLTVYFPVEMYISQAKIPKFSRKWILLKLMSMICFLVSLISACASIQGLAQDVRHYRPFRD